jgi:hypothetical protein
MTDPEHRTGNGWDTGYVPLAMVLIAYVSALVPIACCGGAVVLAGATSPVVAGCIVLGDRMEGHRISRTIWWSFGLVLLLPVWVLLLRALFR